MDRNFSIILPIFVMQNCSLAILQLNPQKLPAHFILISNIHHLKRSQHIKQHLPFLLILHKNIPIIIFLMPFLLNDLNLNHGIDGKIEGNVTIDAC